MHSAYVLKGKQVNDFFTFLGWALFYLASLFAIWQLASQTVERKTFHKLESLRRRNDCLQSVVCNLEGEIGAVRQQLAKARKEAVLASREASLAAMRFANGPKVDELHVYGADHPNPQFADTQSMELCHV